MSRTLESHGNMAAKQGELSCLFEQKVSALMCRILPLMVFLSIGTFLVPQINADDYDDISTTTAFIHL